MEPRSGSSSGNGNGNGASATASGVFRIEVIDSLHAIKEGLTETNARLSNVENTGAETANRLGKVETDVSALASSDKKQNATLARQGRSLRITQVLKAAMVTFGGGLAYAIHEIAKAYGH